MASGTAARLDVHPRNRDRIADPTVELWITEGVKKADALTARGACVVALAGVYNWRSTMGTLGDWEDIPLKGRDVVVCFDADAHEKPNVLRAMQRLGRWLQSKGATPLYLITPGEVDGRAVKGADDYLAAGGSFAKLRAEATKKAPTIDATDATFSDAMMAETIADEVLRGRYLWCKGLGWLGWDGRRWDAETTDGEVTEAVRQYVLDRFDETLRAERSGGGQAEARKGWNGMLGAGRIGAVLRLAQGIVEHRADQFDADPDLLNTPSGVADLTTGELHPHDPELLITRITRGAYRPGYTHPDWTAALKALPEDCHKWWQNRIGQAVTGHPTPDGVLPVLQGGGENGKSLLTTDGLVPALGDFADVASPKLITAARGTEHSTEMADLRGKRLLIAEEMTEGRALDVTMIKRIMDVGWIKARYVHRDNMSFPASHSLFATSNYRPVVAETDHGTWRRLALLVFPYVFRKPGEPLELPTHRRGDPALKRRIRDGAGGQHDAIVTWAVQGAVMAHDAVILPKSVQASTKAWRTEADRILGYWSERLIPDRDACVLAAELLEDFNDWLKANGHERWSKETFKSKFETHTETLRHRVEQRRERAPDRVMRRPILVGQYEAEQRARPIQTQERVWRGVRWRTDSDQQE
jgi:putative DNA primase/helicase